MAKWQTDDVRGHQAKKKYKKKSKKKNLTRKDVYEIAHSVVDAKPERKNFDYVNPGLIVPPGTNGLIFDLTDLTNGTTDITRIGNEITLEYLGLRFFYRQLSTSSMIICNARVLVFQWYPDTAVDSPAISSILASTNYINGFFNRENSGQYKVLYDQRMLLQNEPTSDNFSHLIDISLSSDIKGLRKTIHYNDSATTGTNHIFCMIVNDTTDATYRPLTDHIYSRLIYTDS